MHPSRIPRNTQPRHAGTPAFTRAELLVALATIALLSVAVLPALAQGRARSLQAVCLNNLRTIGQAIGMFNAENAQSDPWRTSWGAASGLKQNCWFQFYALSNHLPDPRVLACPSDALVRPARDYSFDVTGGFLNARQQNNAVSYTIGLDSSAYRPDSVLAADRNLRCPGGPAACSSGVNPALTIHFSTLTPSGWNDGLHGPSGNLLVHDGRVEMTSHESVNRWFRGTDDNGSTHFLSPRMIFP